MLVQAIWVQLMHDACIKEITTMFEMPTKHILSTKGTPAQLAILLAIGTCRDHLNNASHSNASAMHGFG